MGTVTPFPVKRVGKPLPDSVRVGFDFGAWCVELRQRDRLLLRLPAVSEDTARVEAARLARTGLRLLADAPIIPTQFNGDDGGGDAA